MHTVVCSLRIAVVIGLRVLVRRIKPSSISSVQEPLSFVRVGLSYFTRCLLGDMLEELDLY